MSSPLDITPPLAAAISIVPAFRGMMQASAEQLRKPIVISRSHAIQQGLFAAPTVGAIIGTQMLAQKRLEHLFFGEKANTPTSKLTSSAMVGILSAPFIAIYNGQTMGHAVRRSIRRITPTQILAIAFQETAFVGGLSAADLLSGKLETNITVEYSCAFFSGGVGSLLGHPANTLLTRLQAKASITSKELFLGAATRARATGLFALTYKFSTDLFSSWSDNKSACKNSGE